MRVSNEKELNEALGYMFSYFKPSVFSRNSSFEYGTSVTRGEGEDYLSYEVQLLVFDDSGKEVFKFTTKKETIDVSRDEDLLNETCSDFYRNLLGYIMVTFSETQFK